MNAARVFCFVLNCVLRKHTTNNTKKSEGPWGGKLNDEQRHALPRHATTHTHTTYPNVVKRRTSKTKPTLSEWRARPSDERMHQRTARLRTLDVRVSKGPVGDVRLHHSAYVQTNPGPPKGKAVQSRVQRRPTKPAKHKTNAAKTTQLKTTTATRKPPNTLEGLADNKG